MASPGNQHCANCIGTLSFPIAYNVSDQVLDADRNCHFPLLCCLSSIWFFSLFVYWRRLMYSEYDATADSSVVNRIRLLIRPKILLIRKSKCFVCFLCIRHYNVAFLRDKFVAAFDHKILATILICFIFMRLLPSCTGGKYCDKPVCRLCLCVCLSVCLRGHLKKQLSKLNYKCKKLNSLKHLVRTTVAGSHN